MRIDSKALEKQDIKTIVNSLKDQNSCPSLRQVDFQKKRKMEIDKRWKS